VALDLTLARAAELTRHFEGCRLTAYRCPAGYWTIGWGHLLSLNPHADLSGHPAITQADADRLLEEDLRKAAGAVLAQTKVPLTDGQLAALTDFVFNLGPVNFKTSTLRVVVNEGRHEDVPGQLRRWVYSRGVKLPGLVRRREAEIGVYLS
jgi:lysozyme